MTAPNEQKPPNKASIDVFYQGMGISSIEHIEIEHDATFNTLKSRLVEQRGMSREALLFLEDEDQPIEETTLAKDLATIAGLKVHIHCCRHVAVSVAFNGEIVEHRFSPSTTVAHVKRWAAEKKFGMSDDEAGEHVLQIGGTHDRPSPGTHIGALTDGKACALTFDLVPDERVNGSPEETE